MLAEGLGSPEDCPFYAETAHDPTAAPDDRPALHGPEGCAWGDPERLGRDVLGNTWDFVIKPLPGEPSARKIILPFRSDLVEKWAITAGDIVLGRPAGAGCPVQHVLRVIRANPVTGALDTWVVGPRYSRDRKVKDVEAYHMLAFEGLADDVRRAPVVGCRHTFLPGFCMMHLNHTGLVNMALKKGAGLHLRIEDIRILAGPPA